MKKLLRILYVILVLEVLCIATLSAFGGFQQKPMLGVPISSTHPLGTGGGGLVFFMLGNEGSGNTVFDLSGNGYNGTFGNTPVWVPGNSGPAIDFEAADTDYIDCGTAFQVVSGLTVIACVKPESITGYPTIIGKWVEAGANTKQWKLVAALNGGNPYIDISDNGSNDIYRQGTASLSLDVYTTIAITYNGSELHFYKNGQLDDGTLTGAVPSSLHQSASKLIIGHQGDETNDYDGLISYIIIYNRALSPSEVAEIYADFTVMMQKDDIALMAAGVPAPTGGQVIMITSLPVLFFGLYICRKYKAA